MKITSFLLKSTNDFFKISGIVLSSSLIATMSYIVLAWSAINDIGTLNSWTRDYLFSYFIDFIISD